MRETAQSAEFQESQHLEADRLRFLEQSWGRDAALAFAQQTMRIYRRAVVRRSPPAGNPEYRLRLLASYCYLKDYCLMMHERICR